MSWHPPSPDTITVSPERAVLALLASAVAVTKNALLATHPDLPIEEAEVLGPASYVEALAEALLGQLDAIASTVHRYERADDLATQSPFRSS